MNRCKDNQSKVNIQRLLLILLVFVAVTTNGQTTWLGTTDSDWNTPGNWSNGVPGINDDVTIGDVTNDPVISVSGAVAKSITIELDGLLTITIDGTLTIDGAATQAILNLGTLENNGTITLGATTGNGLYGIRNEAIFNNYRPINIDRSTISGINNLNGTFYNSATINIGTVEGNGDYGIKNNASFISYSSINIDRSTNSAIYNTAGIFENGSDLNIGAIASVGSYGIKNEADFNNNSQIYINRSSIAAISNLMGTFNNNSTLTLGNLESIGDYGINNEALFNHNSESINVDKSEIDGIYNLSGTFTNTATIIIGANYPVGTHGIRNESAFDNNGSIQIDRSTTSGIFMSNGLFTNNSNVTIGANVSIADLITANMGTFSHVSGTLSGTGSIAANKFSNAGGTLSPGYSPGILTFDADEDFTNSSMLIEITGGGGTGGTDFDLIYVDGIATIGANTNLSLEFSYAASDGTTFDVLTANNISGTIPIGNITFTNVGAGNITGVSVSYPGNNKIRITVSTPATWTGNIDTDWQNGGNWSSGVPDATDVVIIPDEANDPTISSGAVAKTLTIQNGAVLTITSGGTLSINGSMTEQGLLNQGTVDNSGILNIGNTNGNGWYGIRNEGTFSNNPNGIINIDRSTDAGLYNVSGVFTNQGEIIIGGIANSGYYGISNNTEFNNNTGGNININQVTSVGILHQSDIFTNEGLITIGNNPSTSVYDGIQSLSSFNNNTGGEIKIDRTINNGYFNNAGTITNEATIIIGANASVGEYGVQNNGSFANNSGGMINIDRSNINGIYHVSGTFINHAIINIGTISNTGDNGIENSPAFVNDIDGTINIDRATNYGIRSHSNTFTNQGNISIGALVSIPNLITGKFSNATNGTLNGAGTIQASNFSNDGGTLAPGIPLGKMTYNGSESFNNCTLNLEINGAGGVGGVDFDQIVVSGTATMGSTSFLNLIFTYATDNGATFDIISATSTSGTFNTSNVTFSNTGAGNVTAVSLTYISGKVRVTVTTSNIWSGSISSDWNVAGNWSAGVPDATNFIIIPDVTNDPNINNSVAIQGLKIETGGLLNIESTGTLTINGSQTGQGILNQGTIQNNGILNVGSTTSTGPIGIRNEGTINNNSGGTVNVDRATDIQLYNSGGTITNVANINLGALINVGIIGIKNESVFENNAGGTIKIDRFSAGTPNTTAINNISGSFTNVATITIGAISGGGCQYGIINNATFSNNTGGIINMDAVSKAGIKNSSGTFTNQSSITIGSIASSSVLEGILNESAFNNNSGGIIAIDRFSGMNSAGIHNSMGTLTNQGTITIGATAGSGYYGIKNDAQFNNNSGGVVNIDRSTHEIYNSSGTFTNESTIIIGMVDLAGYNGVSNYAEFFNNSGGTINIDRMYDYGIFNFAGTFSNHANINIGNVGYNGAYGIRNYSTFINSSGLIKIDRTAIIAIWNSTGTFTNHAEI